ncbi:MAG: glycoside hydrolase family 3 C-terminal domain-containing protein [Muribaculaceae bacterium]|nr:glycoside hydrolase family 3 C-terminal domain-containing protein [Muribaculaceae bacterium]
MKRLISTIAIVLMLATTTVSAQKTKPIYLDSSAPLEQRVEDALSRMTLHEKIQVIHAQSKFTSAGVPRLGIRQLNMDDGPHGVREELEWNTWSPAQWTNDSIVAFPSLTCLAATWNRDLSALYGNALSEEFAFRGKDILLGPGVNMARLPLNGRAFEYMGEDPYLAGEMVVPYIKAAQANGVACCIKHFFLNNQEVDRFAANVNVSERAINEIYLPAFKKAVEEAHVWSVMGSYNLWQGVHCCNNDSLLNGILKRQWGFDGAVISDWGGTTDTWQAATGGLDIEMGSYTDGKTRESEYTYDDYYMARPLETLIKEGKLDESYLDDKVRRVLRTMFRTCMNPDKAIGKQCSEDHYEACLAIGEEGITLLRNEKNILPIAPERYKKILVVGENATRSLTQGGGSSELKTLRDISPLEAIKKLYGDKVDYAQGYLSGRAMYDHVDEVDPSERVRLREEALRKAKNADLIIYIGGLNKNHKEDCENGDRLGYDLSFEQNELIEGLAKIQKNMIVITFGGNPYAMPWLNKIKGLLHCWYLGSMGGDALAGVLSGKVNPSGKLPVTFAKTIEDYPYYKYGTKAYPGENKQVYYSEGIYIGYRHFDTRKIEPQFPFGYGLSYTTFMYGEPTLTSAHITNDTPITLSVPVTNTGKVAGKEIVQLYISDLECSVDRPRKELKNFVKLDLAPGETKTAEFTITLDDLKYYSETIHDWTVEPGKFRAYVSSNSSDEDCHVEFSY